MDYKLDLKKKKCETLELFNLTLSRAASFFYLAGVARDNIVPERTLTLLFTVNTETPSMKKITRYVDQLTKKIIPNGPAQMRTRHQDDDQVTLAYPSTAFPSSSFPTRPGSSTPTDFRLKGSLISRVRRQIGKKSNGNSRCTSFAQLARNNC